MESIAALSLACNIIQVIQTGCEIAGAIYQIQKKGSSDGNDDIEQRSKDLLEITSDLRASLTSVKPRTKQTDTERRLLEIADRCSKNVVKLNYKLNKLKSTGKWTDSVLKGVKAIRSRDDIGKLEQALQGDMMLIQTQVLSDLRVQQNAAAITQQVNFVALDTSLRSFIQQVASGLTITQDLIRETHQTSTRRNQSLHAETQQKLTTEHLLTRQAVHGEVDTVLNKLKAVQLSDTKREKRVQFLKSVKFSEMNLRANEVWKAYPNTYRWIFEREPATQPFGSSWDSFPEWLYDNKPLYWIQGSAGSGKSTLMKFILENLDSVFSQCQYARDGQVVISHFFWLAGSDLQNSLKGLSCSLLHQILTRSDDEQVDKIIESDSMYMLKDSVSDWSEHELQDLLISELASIGQNQPVYIFLDGLDEFKHNGFPQKLFQLITKFSRLAGIKICASSRPEQTFINAFVDKPGLRLHDLTRSDIARVVSDRLTEAASEDTSNILSTVRESIMNDLIERADGIFLWVQLAMDEVVRGLRICESSQGLQEIAHKIPKTVTLLYDSMLKRAGEDFGTLRTEAALYFNIMLFWHTRSDVISEKYVEYPLDETSCNILVYTYLRHTLTSQHSLAKVQTLGDYNSIREKCRQTSIRIRVACAGMLRVSEEKSDSDWGHVDSELGAASDWTAAKPARRLHEFCSCVTIQPYHRSVLDFLCDTTEGIDILQNCVLSEAELTQGLLRGVLFLTTLYKDFELKFPAIFFPPSAYLWEHESPLKFRFFHLATLTASQHLRIKDSSVEFLAVLLEIRQMYENSPYLTCQENVKTKLFVRAFPPPDDWVYLDYGYEDYCFCDLTGFIICHGVIELIDGPYGFLEELANVGLQPTQRYLDYLLWLVVFCISADYIPMRISDLSIIWTDRVARILTRLLELGASPHAGLCLHMDSAWKSTAWTVFLTNFTIFLMGGRLAADTTSNYWTLCQHIYRELSKAEGDPASFITLAWSQWDGSGPDIWLPPHQAVHERNTVMIQLPSAQVVHHAFATASSRTSLQIHEARTGLILHGTVVLAKFPRASSSKDFQKVDVSTSRRILKHFSIWMSSKARREDPYEDKYHTIARPLLEGRINATLARSSQDFSSREELSTETGIYARLKNHTRGGPKYKLQLQALQDQGFQDCLAAAEIDVDYVISRISEENDLGISDVIESLLEDNVEEVVLLHDYMVEMGIAGTLEERRPPRMACPLIEDDKPNANEAEGSNYQSE